MLKSFPWATIVDGTVGFAPRPCVPKHEDEEERVQQSQSPASKDIAVHFSPVKTKSPVLLCPQP